MRRTSTTQRQRLVALALNLALLCATTWAVTGSPLAELGGQGLWFYSAAIAFLLADLVVEPWYTKPADALVNAAAAGIAVVTASRTDYVAVSHSTFRAVQLGWAAACLVVIAFALFAMATKPHIGEPTSRLHRLTF